MRKSAVYRVVAAVICLGFALPAFADKGPANGKLKGKLMNFAGKPIASARIELRLVKILPGQAAPMLQAPGKELPPLITKTNKKGLWAFERLESGTWEVTALADGHLPVSRTCEVCQVWDKSLILLEAEKDKDLL